MAFCNHNTLRHCLSRLLLIFSVSYILSLLSLLQLERFSYQLQNTTSLSGRINGEIRQSSNHAGSPRSKHSIQKGRKLFTEVDSEGTSGANATDQSKSVFLRRLKESNMDVLEPTRSKYEEHKTAEQSFQPLHVPERSDDTGTYSFSPMPSLTTSQGLNTATKMPKDTSVESQISASPSKNISNQDELKSDSSHSIVYFKPLGGDFYVYGVYLDDRYFPETYVRIMVLRPAKYTSDVNDSLDNTDTSDGDSGHGYSSSNIWCHFDSTVSLKPDSQSQESFIHIRAKTVHTINVRATPYEMCENHNKKFGGWIYSCPIPNHLVNFTAGSSGTYPEAVTLSRSAIGTNKDRETLQNIRLVPLRRDLKEKVSKRDSDNFNVDKILENYIEDNSIGVDSPEKVEENFDDTKNRMDLDLKGTSFLRKSKSDLRLSQKSGDRSKLNFKQLSIGVCVPPMYGAVLLQKVINFIELCNIMGAQRVFLYSHDSPEVLLRYLSQYTGQRPDILNLVRWNLPLSPQKLQQKEPDSSTRPVTSSATSDTISSKSGQQFLDDLDIDEALPYHSDQTVWNHGQLLAVQHCLYSNMADYDWLLFMDLDEMLVPRNLSSWPELIAQTLRAVSTTKHINQDKLAGLSFQSAFFQQDFRSHITNSIDYFQYLHRTQQTSSKRSKMLVRPRKVFELGIHHLSKPVVVDGEERSEDKEKSKGINNDNKDSYVFNVPQSDALIHHYRKCVQDPDEPDEKKPTERIRGSAWTENGWVPLETFESGSGGSNFECNILVKDETILKYEAELTIVSRNATNSALKFFAQES